MKSLRSALWLSGWLLAQTAGADVRLPSVFGQHMVLQRQKPVPVWGWAAPGERVTVTLSGQAQTTTADATGNWRLYLPALEAGGPHVLTVQGAKHTVTIKDVLVGEVWVCSGQSNMEWPVAQAANADDEIRQASYPTIRQFLVQKTVSAVPTDNVVGTWRVCSPQTVGSFTAVGYFFARRLAQELNVPIGLINTSWGGTHSETWTSRQAMESDADLRPTVAGIPTDLEAMRRRNEEKLLGLIRQQQNGRLPTAAEQRAFPTAQLNDAAWPTMPVPGKWERSTGNALPGKALPGLNGVVWFRREMTVPAQADLSNVVLNLGPIDDKDSTFVNGQLVGAMHNHADIRQYKLPAGLLKPGRNWVAVRVRDQWGEGGFWGKPDQLRLTGTNFEVPLAGNWRFQVAEIHPSSLEVNPNQYATLLFNGMVAPLIPYAMRGVIWYQGESNAGRAYQYRKAFPLLIQDWRQQWSSATGRPDDFPFLFVQLASFNSANGDSRRGSTWAELREAQTAALQLPNTGMAVTADIGERDDIHPRNKQDVGGRLAAQALRLAYGRPDVVDGPTFERAQAEPGRLVVTFRNVGRGLVVKDKYGYVRGFEVAGADRQFHYAKAEVRGQAVVVWCDGVAAPVAVRYGWADDNGDVNLYNQEGFPAVPFRSDTWPGLTEGVKF